MPYSITSSAASRSCGGTVKPIELAVFKLITSSSLTGNATAHHPGEGQSIAEVCHFMHDDLPPCAGGRRHRVPESWPGSTHSNVSSMPISLEARPVREYLF